MIAGSLYHLQRYAGINPGFDKAIAYLENLKDTKSLKAHDKIDGERVYYNFGPQTTRKETEAKYEAHRKYIDIHICLKGQERILIAPVEKLLCTEEYNPEQDVQWFEGAGKWDITLETGDFLICFPEDAHMPLLDNGKKTEVDKMIVKVAV